MDLRLNIANRSVLSPILIEILTTGKQTKRTQATKMQLLPECSRQEVTNSKLVSAILSVFIDNDSLLRSTNSQNASLRWVDNSREVLDTKHTQVGDGEGTRLHKELKRKERSVHQYHNSF